MRVAQVATNETCNHACRFCLARRPGERASIAARPTIHRRIDEAIAAGADEIVLTGGEPTLRRDLAAIVAYAVARGARTVVLETNGARLDAEKAQALRAAGLGRARVHTPAWGPAADAITGDAGGSVRAQAALAALAAAGVDLELSVPIVQETLPHVAALPAAVAASGLPIAALVVVVPVAAPAEGRTSLLGARAAAAAVTALAEAARQAGVAVRMSTTEVLPPCLFSNPGRVAHLYGLTPGGALRPGYQKLPACADCGVADRCPGVAEPLLAREPALRALPIADDRVRRRLSVISTVAHQIARELSTDELYRVDDGSTVPARTVRINFHCNQACTFCFVSTHLPPAEDGNLRAAIVEAARAGGVVVLSGGEPTLHPRLCEYVTLARGEGARAVELQTNAIRLVDPELLARLLVAGLTDALVSLHGATADVADAVTVAPGTFVQTLRGLDELARTRIRTRVNFVFCQENYRQFPATCALIAKRWPQAALTVSFVAPSTDVVPMTRALIPRYRDVLPELTRGLALARAAGLTVTGFDSMCGFPLCLVPDELARTFRLAEIPTGWDRGEFTKPGPCRSCALDSRCFGLRRGYAELYGADELRPVAAAAPAGAPAAP
jgi:MoaA/NifB/PqqE/SkfB family radical SAM enzyme